MPWDTIYDVVDHVSTSLAIPIAVVGFWIAIVQINRTKSEAVAAKTAAEKAINQVGRSSLLVLLPQLQRTEEELERGIQLSSRDLCSSWLNTWRWQAGQLRGHLRQLPPVDHDLEKKIQASITAAATAKNSLMSSSGVDPAKATQSARRSIAAVTAEIGNLVADHTTQSGAGS